MATAVRRTASLPADLDSQAADLARAEVKTLSGAIQDGLRRSNLERRMHAQVRIRAVGQCLVRSEFGT